jgi:hypothetical protein
MAAVTLHPLAVAKLLQAVVANKSETAPRYRGTTEFVGR